uniref:Major sperm protein n=1 Tax=Panagrolaimus superbus TaxID=310955 RepID=A0A914XWU5_9BILA
MEKHPQVLRLDPSTELTFNGNNGFGKAPFAEVVNTKLRLDNPSDTIVYFKVKTTAPKHYCVRPNSGVIKPGSSAEISVLLQPVDDPSVLEREGAKHKFMIQSAYATNDVTPVDEFWKSITSADVMDSKLRVVFSSAGDGYATPAAHAATTTIPPMQQPSHPRSQTTKPFTSAYDNTPVGVEKTETNEVRRRHDAEKQKLDTDNRKLQDQLSLLRQQLQSTAIASEGGLPTVHVALLAIAMFLIGVILGKMI